jgi:hypothetical protein
MMMPRQRPRHDLAVRPINRNGEDRRPIPGTAGHADSSRELLYNVCFEVFLMSLGPTKIDSKGACIYCGAAGVRLTDEHVVPLSLGGQHIIEKASCDDCAKITARFERDVAREMWGDARISYNAPSRRKKERKSYIILTDPDNPERKVKVPYSEYPAAMISYKMHRCGLLEGMPENVDLSAMWQFSAIHDDAKAKDFEKKFGIKLTSKFRHVPESFARLLAKIGYCNLLCVLDPGDFRPICVPYILGRKGNPSYIVGGTFDIADPNPDLGYILNTVCFGTAERLMLLAEIRLFANAHTPTYHAVVGDVAGAGNIASVLKKLGEVSVAQMPRGGASSRTLPDGDHWMPRFWPLPFWTAESQIRRD